MKERPILMNAEMVRAILDGRKTQTRRPIKAQPPDCGYILATCISTTGDRRNEGKHHWVKLATDGRRVIDGKQPYFSCPFGQRGDHLWVRETFFDAGPFLHAPLFYEKPRFYYRADDAEIGCHRWTPSIHMPRHAARIILEVTAARVERVQDITEAAAKAEGVPPAWLDVNGKDVNAHAAPTFRQGFARTMREIYGWGLWEMNMWVWVVEFKRVQP